MYQFDDGKWIIECQPNEVIRFWFWIDLLLMFCCEMNFGNLFEIDFCLTLGRQSIKMQLSLTAVFQFQVFSMFHTKWPISNCLDLIAPSIGCKHERTHTHETNWYVNARAPIDRLDVHINLVASKWMNYCPRIVFLCFISIAYTRTNQRK